MQVNGDFSLKSNKSKIHNPLLPDNLRLLICGASGSGKTIVLLNLLLQDDWLDYNSLIITGESLFQPEYMLLRECLEIGLTKPEIRDCFIAKKNIIPEKEIKKLTLVRDC